MKNRSILMILLLGTLLACSTSHKVKPDVEKWSVKLADAVMSRNDSLAIYNNPSSIKWTYDIAMLGQAIASVDSGSALYFNYYKAYIDLFVKRDGSIETYKQTDYNLDNFNPAKELLVLYKATGDEKYKQAIQNMMNQLVSQPRVDNGGYCHKAIYDQQIWVNSQYMLSPFLAEYAHDFNQPEWYDSVCFQLENTYHLTVDKSDGLLYHAWDCAKRQPWADGQTGLSPNKWSRGMGWYMMGLVDVLEFLPANHYKRNTLIAILEESSEALLTVRDKETGLWYQILNLGDKEFNYIETSGSAMFIYAFAKGANLGVLPARYREVAVESFNSLVTNFVKVDIDGLPSLTHISGSAGLGVKLHRDGSFEYYINQTQIDNDPKGMAPLIMAAKELDL